MSRAHFLNFLYQDIPRHTITNEKEREIESQTDMMMSLVVICLYGPQTIILDGAWPKISTKTSTKKQ